MRALIFDGSPAGDAIAESLVVTLREQLAARGYTVEHMPLRERRIGNCAGDFFCLVRSPGMCMTDDANRVLAARVVRCDLLILLSPLTFGGYASTLKRMLDHLIQNIMPFFTRIGGEVHHKPRYKRYPNILAVGWQASPDESDAAVFRHLVRRNAINMYARVSVSDVIASDEPDLDLEARCRGWIEAIERGESSPVPALPEAGPSFETAEPVRKAVLLVGSPRTAKSSSAALGGYLMERLAARGAEVQTFQIYLRSPELVIAMREAIAAADLIVLAFPLYIDTLPAPVIELLERLATEWTERAAGLRLAAIVNCGFPEAHHCANALRVCASFARHAGLAWAGGLALGAGEGVVGGRPLAQAGALAAPVRRALDVAAEALAAGGPVPRAATERLARPIIPAWLYLLVASMSWRRLAREFGAQGQLARRPYEASEG